MALPKQIQASIDEAQRIEEELRKAQGDEAPQEVAEEAAPEAEAPADAATSFDAEPAEVTDISPESEESEEEEEPGEAGFEHKYKTLQGMFNSEKRRNSELAGRIEGLESMLARLREPREEAPQEPAATPPSISQEEVEEYGSDLIDVMKRAAREAVQDEIAELRQENLKLKQVIGGVGQRQEMSERDKFYTQLTALVPDWQKMNNDPDFLNWLEQNDVYAGQSRRAMLGDAFEKNDAERVSNFFTGYLKENAAVSQPAPTPQAQPKRRPKVDMATMVSPGQSGAGVADNSNADAGRVWKESDIASFYAAAQKGHFKGRDEDYRRIEQQIQTAMNEGNILVGQ